MLRAMVFFTPTQGISVISSSSPAEAVAGAGGVLPGFQIGGDIPRDDAGAVSAAGADGPDVNARLLGHLFGKAGGADMAVCTDGGADSRRCRCGGGGVDAGGAFPDTALFHGGAGAPPETRASYAALVSAT